MEQCRRSPFLLSQDPPNSLSDLIFDRVIPRSLQSPLDSGHHNRAIGAGQHTQLRCSLEFGQSCAASEPTTSSQVSYKPPGPSSTILWTLSTARIAAITAAEGAGMSHRRLQYPFKPLVVFHQKVCDRPGLFVLTWFHPVPPILLLAQLTSLRGERPHCRIARPDFLPLTSST
jgi:hypothetical protein